MTTFYERAQKGAALLDQGYPDWAQSIDLKHLHMCTTCHCVLGQVISDDFLEAMDFLHLDGNTVDNHGFDLTSDETNDIENWEKLQRAWIRVINERRNS